MKLGKYMLSVLAAALLAACAEPENEAMTRTDEGTRITLFGEGSHEVTAYAFRKQGDRFLFDTLFREGWTADGRLSVRMRSGSYKFLFAGGGEDLALQPDPLTRQSAWEEVAYALREDDTAPGSYLPAGELFLQFPAADAETIYTVSGTDQTVRARLSRAVCRILITLKRGFKEGSRYFEAPYAAPQSVLDGIGRIEMTASGTGLCATPAGSCGTAVVRTAFSAGDFTVLPETGFARVEGPYLLPPADGGTIVLDLTVLPATGAALAPAQLQLNAPAERNKQIDVTLWITSGYPAVGIEIDTSPIDEERTGDAGVWE